MSFVRWGKRWYPTITDMQYAKVLRDIRHARRVTLHEGIRPASLVAWRDDFRGFIRNGRVTACFLNLNQRDSESVCIALWLIGRMQAKHGVSIVADYRSHADARVRREAARALRRLGAWSELRAMADDTSPLVRGFTRNDGPRPLAVRLERFKQTITPLDRPMAHVRTSWFASLPLGPGRQPKPAHLIRALLERIRRLVHST
jgi:hypothetical protein